jgi:hypothetical protein
MTALNPSAILIFAVTLASAIAGSYVTIASTPPIERALPSGGSAGGHDCRKAGSQTTQKACKPSMPSVARP